MSKYNLSVKEFLEKSASGEIDYADFSEKFLDEVKKADKKFELFTAIDDSKPDNPKLKIDRPRLNLLPEFFGLPISVKDNICVKGIQSTAGSKILEGYKPPFDATCVRLLKEASGWVFGKTNQDEFGFGTFSTNSAYGIPKNPLDRERSCGGSSGGAAGGIVAINMPHIAVSESTGGSISAPASFCGVAGLTPTYGLVSRYGLIDYANSLDKIGVIAKSVWDISFALSAMAGFDSRDSTSINKKQEDYRTNLNGDVKNLKIGIPKEYMENLDEKIEKALWNSIKKLESLGATYHEISLPHTKYSLAAYYIIATAEASTNLAKFSGMRYGHEEEISGSFNEYFSKVRTKYFGQEAKRRILLGTFARMAGYRDQYYLKALKVRTLVIDDFQKAFKKVDVLASPAMPVIAPKFSDVEKLTPIKNYMMDILTVGPNLAGVPMISVPCGQVNGMPIGLHLIGDHLQEKKVLDAGFAFENTVKAN